jgi:hypothetical protein
MHPSCRDGQGDNHTLHFVELHACLQEYWIVRFLHHWDKGFNTCSFPYPLPFDLHIYGIIYSFYGARSNGIKISSNFRIHEFNFKGLNGKVCRMSPSFEFLFTTIIFNSGGKFKVLIMQNYIANWWVLMITILWCCDT